jgi:hypothetical protein
MTEGVKWTLAGVIAFLISIVGGLIILKFGVNIRPEELKWVIGVSIPILIILWAGFVKAVESMKQKELSKYYEEMNNKADRTLTDSRFKEQEIIVNDFKEKNESQINSIHQFMASIDSNIKNVDSKLAEMNTYLLNKKR